MDKSLTLTDILNEYSLVYCFLPKTIMKRNDKGYFVEAGKRRGILIKRVHNGCDVWYHNPENYISWKSFLRGE